MQSYKNMQNSCLWPSISQGFDFLGYVSKKNDIIPQLEKHFCRVVVPKLGGKTRLHELARFDPSSDPWCWSFDGIEHSGNVSLLFKISASASKEGTYGQLQSSKNNCFSMPRHWSTLICHRAAALFRFLPQKAQYMCNVFTY